MGEVTDRSPSIGFVDNNPSLAAEMTALKAVLEDPSLRARVRADGKYLKSPEHRRATIEIQRRGGK